MAEARWLVSPARVFARPTADQIWLGPAQQAALSQLSGTTRVRSLVGPPSSGKSTLLNHVSARLGAESADAYQPRATPWVFKSNYDGALNGRRNFRYHVVCKTERNREPDV